MPLIICTPKPIPFVERTSRGAPLEQVIYLTRTVTAARLKQIASKKPLAPLEPVLGCYIGAFIAREDVSRVVSEDGRDLRDAGDFEKIVGKRHAVYFNYVNLEKTGFPEFEGKLLLKRNAAFHIALEPETLDQISDRPESTLTKFAQAVAASGTPVFIRFASEMNGKWTWKDWGVTPEKYVSAFRMVANVCRREMHNFQAAHLRPDGTKPPDNVAMVWSPSPYGVNPEPFYPGKEYVDWVGVNFYSVLHRNDGSGRSSEFENPLDTIPYVYDRWAKDHPIMIGEWAATHESKFSSGSRPDFAVNKIGQLYAGISRIYPRVKCINYFSMNALKYAEPDRRTNNFSLFTKSNEAYDKRSPYDKSEAVAGQYSSSIDSSYFLRKVLMGNQTSRLVNSKVEYVRAPRMAKVRGRVELTAFVRSDVERPLVEWKVPGLEFPPYTIPGDYRIKLDTTKLKNGPLTVTLVVHHAQTTKRTTTTLVVEN